VAVGKRYLLFLSVMPTDMEPYRTFSLGDYDTVEELEKAASTRWYAGERLTSWDCKTGIPHKAWCPDGTVIDLATQHNVILGRQAAIRAVIAEKSKPAPKSKKKKPQAVSGEALTALFQGRRQA
jgi:hypothetical protein